MILIDSYSIRAAWVSIRVNDKSMIFVHLAKMLIEHYIMLIRHVTFLSTAMVLTIAQTFHQGSLIRASQSDDLVLVLTPLQVYRLLLELIDQHKLPKLNYLTF